MSASTSKLVVTEDGKVYRDHGPYNPIVQSDFEQIPPVVLETKIGVATFQERRMILEDRSQRDH